MPRLELPPEQQQKLQALIINLRQQDNVITLLAEFALAGYNAASVRPPQRLVRVTPDGQVEFAAYPGPKLVEEGNDEATPSA